LYKYSAVANQNSLKGAKDVTKVIDFAQVSRFHTPNNTGLVRKANKIAQELMVITKFLNTKLIVGRER
jgi:hypothetical protein